MIFRIKNSEFRIQKWATMLVFCAVIILSAFFILHSSFISPALAAGNIDSVIGTVTPPAPIQQIPGTTGEEKIGSVLSTIIRLIYIVATTAFVFMIVWSAFQWITSGGDKEALAGARKRIINAIIGLILLSLSFVIITIIGTITGFTSIFKGQSTKLDPVKSSIQQVAPGKQDAPVFPAQNTTPGRQDNPVR